MSVIELPALDGRHALEFLAACGVLRLVSEVDPEATLTWSPETGCAGIESVELDVLDDVVDLLVAAAVGIREPAILPDGPADFPPGGKGSDPMRVERDSFRPFVVELMNADAEFFEMWIPAMVTDLGDRKGHVDITRFAAPSGQQKFNTMFDKALDAVVGAKNRGHEPKAQQRAEAAASAALTEALRSWRRVDGYTGEYLDHRVLRSGADSTSGDSNEAGVPGATWLALMALPWFPVFGNGTARGGVGWVDLARPVDPARGKPARFSPRRESYFVWPLWQDALNGPAVRAMLGHPALVPTRRWGSESELVAGPAASRRALGVFLLCAAKRQRIQGRNFDGVLTPVPVDQDG